MALARNLTLALLGLAAVTATGCVGPMACGPTDCDVAGPIARNACGGCDGCGELYIDPWINEPAEACDPCDACGNYNGQSCGKCRSIFSGFACLWGYRYDAPAACDNCGLGSCDGCAVGPACDGCAGGCDSCSSTAYGPGEVRGPIKLHRSGVSDGPGEYGPGEPIPSGVPTPAPEVQREAPSGDDAYQPRRTRRIFRNRGGQ